MFSFLAVWSVLLCVSMSAWSHSVLYNAYVVFYGWNVFAILIFIALARAIYWLVLYPKYFTPFRHLPTPSHRWAFTGNETSLFHELPWDVARRWSETIPNNGLIRYYVALSNERLLVTSPKGLSEVLVHGAYDFTKTNLAKFAIQRFTGNGLGFLDGEEHRLQKKNLLSAFTPTHIRTLTPVFWENAKKMVLGIDESIQRSLTGRRLVPLHDWGTRATLDIIGVAGMGYDFGTLNNPNNDLSAQYRKMFLEPSTAFNWLELLGNYVDFRLLLKMPIKKNRELTQGSQYIRRVAQQVIRGKTKLLESNGDLHEETDIISVALASGGFSEEQLVDHVMTFLVAGHESTATAFEWATYEIARRPEMQNRLRREIRTHIPSLKECIDIGSSIESMPYLNAVCSEVLRFYPFVPFATRVASKDNTILGTFVPKGTIVSFAAYATNHDKSLWGPDADQFDPERWMGHKQARSGGSKSNYALLTFSAGAKSCIGQGWTRAELACLVAATVGRFNIELANPKENQLKIGKTMKLKAGVNAYMEVVDGWD